MACVKQTPALGDWDSLETDLTGELTRPGDEAFESWRKPALANFHDIHPQAIVRCRTTDDVVSAVLFARRFSLATAIRSGGHDFAGRSSTTGLLIDLKEMNDLSFTGTLAAVGAGALLGDVYEWLSAQGRAIPGGSCPTVGIGGLSLGGGLGFLGRTYGLTCDRLVQAEVVMPNGRVVECDEERQPDLFWAVCGAGAQLGGVVTTMVFDTVPAPEWTVLEATWDLPQASPVIEAWQRWAPDAPDAVAASVLVRSPAGSQHLPTVTVRGVAVGHSPEATDELFDGFVQRVGTAPRSWWRDVQSWPDSSRPADDQGPTDNAVHLFAKSEFFERSLPSESIGDLVQLLVADRREGEARELDFSPWGGAYNRHAVDATAFPHRTARFLLKHAVEITVGDVDSPAPSASPWLQRSWETARPWGTGGVFQNFPDAGLDQPEQAYFASNLERVNRVRSAYQR
jgi:FAD/FMN-containing dehydrogenase